MQDILANRREEELSRLVQKLKEAEAELQQIRQRQAGLQKKIEAEGQREADPQRRRELQRLTRQQRQLQEESERLMRKLRRLQAAAASRQLAEAAAGMSRSGEAGQAGDAAAAGQHAAEAARDLEQAQRELAQARRQAEADLAQERLAGLQEQLKGIRELQQVVLAETRRLDALRRDQGNLTRGQLVGLTGLAGQQESLHDQTRVMSDKLAGAEIFQRTLARSADKMKAAADRLARRETGDATQRAEQEALARLKLLSEALAPGKPAAGAGQAPGGAGEGGGNQGGGLTSLAELKLLKLLQADLNQRTDENRAAIDQAIRQNQDTGPLQQQRAQLAQEQGELADIMFQMLEKEDQPPEDDPDRLPDLRPATPLDPPDEETDPPAGDEQVPDRDRVGPQEKNGSG